jgi:hypothetical protein
MVAASQNQRAATLLLRHSICSVPTYIMESSELFVLSQNDDERVACDLECAIVTCLLESGSMSYKQPTLVRMSAVLRGPGEGLVPY